MKYRYRNISDKVQLIIGVPGPIDPGDTFDVDYEINNSNFERAGKVKSIKNNRILGE